MNFFPPHLIDFYKSGHIYQMPDKTTLQFNNFTCRGSRLPDVKHSVFFGLQGFMLEYLVHQWNTNFFNVSKDKCLAKYQRRMDKALGVGSVKTDHIADLHDYQRLPLTILALPEGSLVPLRVPSMVYYNSQPDFSWLVGYIETILSTCVWGMINSATIAFQYRKKLQKWAKETGGDINSVPWQGHDFSARGMFGPEAAAMSGAAHLLSFTGTDTVWALDYIEQYYYPSENLFLGGSVPATEHSVMCMGGKGDEIETIKRLITKIYPNGIISVVSDTWDLWEVITSFLPKLKKYIMVREGKLVLRPDSGNPVEILCGVEHYIDETDNYCRSDSPRVPVSEPERKGVIELLYDIFGGTTDDKGYKQLDSHIGAIYGDSITLDRAEQICTRLAAKGFSSTNVVLGIGSYTYQYNTRDTLGQAIKATFGIVNGEERELFKDPKTDKGEKKSARGLLAAYGTSGNYKLKEQATWAEVHGCAFEPVFQDGIVKRIQSFDDIRGRLLGMTSMM